MNHEKANPKNYNLFRLLLTDSKRYMLPLYGDVTVKTDLNNIKNFLCQVMRKSRSQWNDVNQRSRQSGGLTIYKRRCNHLMSNRDLPFQPPLQPPAAHSLPRQEVGFRNATRRSRRSLLRKVSRLDWRSSDLVVAGLRAFPGNFKYGWDLAA